MLLKVGQTTSKKVKHSLIHCTVYLGLTILNVSHACLSNSYSNSVMCVLVWPPRYRTDGETRACGGGVIYPLRAEPRLKQHALILKCMYLTGTWPAWKAVSLRVTYNQRTSLLSLKFFWSFPFSTSKRSSQKIHNIDVTRGKHFSFSPDVVLSYSTTL